MSKKAIVIGGGIGGLATSILLAQEGYNVTLLEKNANLGGRARQFKAEGFTFDMGPSWYLMPQIFEHFYRLIGEDINKHLKLTRLRPGYKVFYQDGKQVVVQGDLEKDAETFESLERGAGDKLKAYVSRASDTYHTAVDNFLYTNFTNIKLLTPKVLRKSGFLLKLMMQPIDSYVSGYVKDDKLKQILEYPMVFLGTSPFEAPALYHLMSHLDFVEGVYYPQGGLHEIIISLEKIAKAKGVSLQTSMPVSKIVVKDGKAVGVKSGNKIFNAELVISNADLYHTETKLLDPSEQTYPEGYWAKKQPGPSAMLFYLGIKGKLPTLEHHNLFFASDWQKNFDDIFKHNKMPHPASLYICKPSTTDKSVAPKGCENLFVLVPVPARHLSRKEQADYESIYFDQIKRIIGDDQLEKRIAYKRIYTANDFSDELNSWNGSALGLSHKLSQSAMFRPKNRSKKIGNLYYVGGSTIPGVGLPMCLIGAELVIKHLRGIKNSKPIGGEL